MPFSRAGQKEFKIFFFNEKWYFNRKSQLLKQIANPMENRLNAANINTEKAMISENGLQAEASNGWSQNVYAMKGFSIIGEACLPNATIVYYFEATYMCSSKLR
jgi:hypothetical protein